MIPGSGRSPGRRERLPTPVFWPRELHDIRNTKGTFQAEMGTIKDRNGMDLIQAEDIKKT